MTPTPGMHDLGPQAATLEVLTTSEGPMARMGHELTLVPDDWRATLVIGATPQECSLRLTADLASLRVTDSRKGLKRLKPDEHDQIRAHLAQSLDLGRYAELSFTSTAVDGTWDRGRVEGQLTLHGRSEVQGFEVRADGDAYTLTGEIVQTRFGITPFSTMGGALRVGDAVGIRVTATL